MDWDLVTLKAIVRKMQIQNKVYLYTRLMHNSKTLSEHRQESGDQQTT